MDANRTIAESVRPGIKKVKGSNLACDPWTSGKRGKKDSADKKTSKRGRGAPIGLR